MHRFKELQRINAMHQGEEKWLRKDETNLKIANL
jgi:hypothetical protein